MLALKLDYDVAGRLANKFEVPAWGNVAPPPTRNATYNIDNQLATLNRQTFSYNTDGNATAAPAPGTDAPLLAYGWNARNQLTSAPIGLSYSYDSEGLRASYTQSGGSPTTFVNDPHGPMSRVLWRIRSDGTRTFYIYGPILLYEIEESAAGGNPANSALYYHYDHLGSTLALTNDAGEVTGRANCGAYGERVQTSGTFDVSFGWQGAFGVQTDPNGLHHMRARYYHARLGRFLSEDPLGLSAGPNVYAYASGNPIMANDPIGLADWWREGGSIGVGFIPFAGTAQSAVELFSVQDYITGEPANRWLAGVGLIAGVLPGGKALLKGGAKVVAHLDDATSVASHAPINDAMRVTQYFDDTRAFPVNGSQALLSPGNTLNRLCDGIPSSGATWVIPKPADNITIVDRLFSGVGNRTSFVEFDASISELSRAGGSKDIFGGVQQFIPGAVDLTGRNATFGASSFNWLDLGVRTGVGNGLPTGVGKLFK